MTDQEADEFRKLFLGIMERNIPAGVFYPESIARRSLGSVSELVTTARMTISEDPPAAASELYRVGEECALCGEVPPADMRQPATLQIDLASGGGFGLGVWVHSECLSHCATSDKQRGIPW
jgi:hypothetical protein